MKKLKIGIVGTGFTIGIASEHIKAYQSRNDVEIAGFFDIVPGRADIWKKEKNIESVKVYESMEELLQNIDAISICVPNDQHIDIGIQAITHQKHFICEKPLSVNYSEGKRLVDYSNAHPEIVSVICLNYRNFPALRYAKKLLDDGLIGQVYSCRQQLGGGRIADPQKVKLEWRMQKSLSGQGALADFGSHMLDLADYLLSDHCGKITSIQGMKQTFIKERNLINSAGTGSVNNDDCAVFSAEMESGTLLSFFASRLGMPYQTLEIIGEGGMLIFRGDHDELGVQLKDKNASYKAPLQFSRVPDEYLGEDGHIGLINEFINAILYKEKVSRNLDRGLYIQELIEKIALSAETGKNIVL